IYEVEREEKGIKHYYEIKKVPILEVDQTCVGIGVFVKDITLKKTLQDKVLQELSVFDECCKNEGLVIGSQNEKILGNIRKIFERYWKTAHFNIWIYDKNKQAVLPYFKSCLSSEKITSGIGFTITQEDIEGFIKGSYQRLRQVDVKAFGECEKNVDILHILIYPIIQRNEFLGVVSMAYDEEPKQSIIDNDYIEVACGQLALIVKYIQMAQQLDKELERRTRLEKELGQFLEISADFLIKTDSNRQFCEVSQGCVDVLGWTRQEFLNMTWEEIIHPDDIESMRQLIDAERGRGESVTWLNRFRCADGSYKWLRWNSGEYLDHRGLRLATAKDITREKELLIKEEQFEKAMQLERLRSEFFANLSHEFGTPINMIISVVQMMQQFEGLITNQEKNREMKRYIGILRQNGYRLLRLVNNLIDITKIDAGFYQIKPVNCNVIYVVEEIVLSVVTYCERKGIELIFDTQIEEEVIACDPDQIERIMLNLLANAIKYTGEGGLIKVNVNLEEAYIVIEVRDTGIGIAEDKLQAIFERFVQGRDVMTRPCEGSGIGLSLVKALVELHNGSISVASEENVGSVFTVKLPRVQMALVQESVRTCRRLNIEKCHIEFSDIYR
ncbi:MAG: PAS domain-containing sensor histidine kinase, partial [Cellulosilyticaceae bacterium]